MSITHSVTATGGDSGALIGQTAWNNNHSVSVTGVLKGSGGDIVAAVAGTDYVTPSSDLGVDFGIMARISIL